MNYNKQWQGLVGMAMSAGNIGEQKDERPNSGTCPSNKASSDLDCLYVCACMCAFVYVCVCVYRHCVQSYSIFNSVFLWMVLPSLRSEWNFPVLIKTLWFIWPGSHFQRSRYFNSSALYICVNCNPVLLPDSLVSGLSLLYLLAFLCLSGPG